MTNAAHIFYNQLEVEVLEARNRLGATHSAYLEKYYSKLLNSKLRAFYRYNWVRRTGPMQQLILSLPRRDTPWRLLDAGCGLGTESIFWSTLRDDVEVVGVDVSTERLETAQARLETYQKRVGKTLNVCFVEENIFTILDSQQFDLVWTMEAISHIDPAESFMQHVFNNFSPHGHLVISDSHILNPAMAWRIYKMRQHGVVERTQKATTTGEVIPYAQERLFRVNQLVKILKEIGFHSVESQLSIFFPAHIALYKNTFSFCKRLERLLNRFPGIRNLGGIYTVTAEK
ncbi:MAG: methyltransferase domain-containing protein [Anaerolineae bacterium]|nr:methyltransferase domain-containing protein [Anaerolineae bacterium]